jgi:FkbH-like protein
VKIACLSSYTIDFLPRETDKRLADFGLYADWYIAPFNQYQQEILDPQSRLKEFQPDIILIALGQKECLSGPEGVTQLISTASIKYPAAIILVHNCALLQPEPIQFLEWNSPASVRLLAAQINCKLAQTAQKLPNVNVLDLESLLQRYGSDKMFDPRFYYLAKMQYSAFGTEKIAQQLASAIAAVAGKRKKCLVLDLDGVLWGGIIGEDGLEHIKLSNDGEGRAFYDFQKMLEKLYKTGTILAVCSKNDERTAMEAIRSHPYMVLREDKFAAFHINWDDKAKNIRAIAEELNLGLDSFVYLDDSPHERELVRKLLPEVTVLDLPEDFSEYPGFLAGLPFFELFSVTPEDSGRTKMYVQERQRAKLKKDAISLDEFIASLGIKIYVNKADAFAIPRIAQLTQKTNQFNLSVRRYTDTEINVLNNNPLWIVLYVSASDRLGDYGIVGVAIIELHDRKARLDTFLMSCRALGRSIENAFLTAEYIPTNKNTMIEGFFLNNGFTTSENNLFIFDLKGKNDKELKFPKWVTVEHEKRR